MSSCVSSRHRSHSLLKSWGSPNGTAPCSKSWSPSRTASSCALDPPAPARPPTLHSALGQINTPERKIWTAEDPVEITQAGLRQVQVKPKIGFTFANAMRAFLRADP